MTPRRRWVLVAIAVVLAISTPLAVRRLPVGSSDLSAATVLNRIRAADDHGYSGTVELSGDLALPVTDHFTDIGSLLGGRTTLRVWWRGPQSWRVDKLLVAGETDLIHEGSETTEWSYEDAKVTRSIDPEIRLPRTADLLPPAFARRLLGDPGASSAVRLPVRRIAGVGAVGIRIRPASPRSSISRVDLWVDPDTGVVLRLEAYGPRATSPAFTTAFSSYSSRTPSTRTTQFETPPGVEDSFERVLDIADAANQYAPFEPPDTVAGLARSGSSRGAVGIYGSGLTQVLAIPLRRGDAAKLLEQVSSSAGMVGTTEGPSVMAGPLGVLVSDGQTSAWLVVGAVTRKTLVAAAHDLETGTRTR